MRVGVASRLKHETISELDWGKPNSSLMCVDPGVRLGEAQLSSGGVTYSPQACHVKWVAPMDERCMTMWPGLDWGRPIPGVMFSDHVTFVFVVGSVQGGVVRAPWCEGIPGCVACGSILCVFCFV
ncbi:hypothetical protein Rs2_29029 [Raphanus sativus]|nr:hypothetical protein Rs2_29029 [Raphanus sativus]